MLADPIEDPVEGRWLDHLAEREFEVVGFEIVLERDQFLAARRFVDPVHHGRLARFERLGRGDVGGDHVILDQLVRVQALARGDRHDPPLFVEHHLALGQVEFERFAPFPSGEQRAPAIPQRPERGFDQFGGNRTGDCEHIAVRRADLGRLLAGSVHRGLRLFVGDVGGDPDDRAGEPEALERTVGRDLQMAGERRPVLALFQRADVAR